MSRSVPESNAAEGLAFQEGKNCVVARPQSGKEPVGPVITCLRNLRHRGSSPTRGLERPFRIRMGISTGFCTVGNFGSQDRMDYTIIGNEVNLASRLESAAEPGSILLANETNALVQDIVLTEEQPPITVKGFLRPINTFKVVGTYGELIDTGQIVLQERDGLRVLVDLSKQDKSEAIAILEEVLSQLRS